MNKKKREFADQALQAGMEIIRPPLKALSLGLSAASFGLNVVKSLASPFLKGFDSIGSSDEDDSSEEDSEIYEDKPDFEDEYGETVIEDSFGENIETIEDSVEETENYNDEDEMDEE